MKRSGVLRAARNSKIWCMSTNDRAVSGPRGMLLYISRGIDMVIQALGLVLARLRHPDPPKHACSVRQPETRYFHRQ